MTGDRFNIATECMEEGQRTYAELLARCKQYESWLRAIDRHADFDVWFKDADGRYQYVNASFERAMGRPREELLGLPPEVIFKDEKRAERVRAVDRQVMMEGKIQRVVPCDGSGVLEMHNETRFAVQDSKGQTVGLGCFAIEVSAQSFAEEALTQAQSIAQLGNWRWSIQEQCLISCSKEFADLLGYSATEVYSAMQDRLTTIVHPDDRDIVSTITNLTDPANCQGYRIEYRIKRSDGTTRYVREIAEPLLGNGGLAVEYVGTLQDITEQKLIEQELLEAKRKLELRVAERTHHLEHLAAHDKLTGLLNRNSYIERFTQRIHDLGDPCKIAVLVLDLDNFKMVNDCYGHLAGDAVLKTVAARLRNTTQDSDMLIRLGGDEFALILFNLKDALADSKGLCKRLREAIIQPISIANIEVRVGCSAGISLLQNNDRDSLEQALAQADMALYKAKALQGVDCMVFETQMAVEVSRKQLLENEFRTAIESGQIGVVYQPQVYLSDLRIAGFEALARWHHPKLGNISPLEFIPIAESCGAIHELSNYVLDIACRDFAIAAKLTPAANAVRLAVNFSAAQFYNEDLLLTIQQALAKHELAAEALEIEVTESLFIENPDRAKELLDSMRDIGLRIALDDFGTGYSALSYLKEFDVDAIKIDRSFVRYMDSTSANYKIIDGIIKLTKSLELTVVAEGVETAAQARLLRSLNCDVAQGYYFGRPITFERLKDEFLLRKNRVA